MQKTRRVRSGEVSLNVVDAGEGPGVLLLHGWPDSSRLWRHQVPALVGAGHRVVAPDLRGFGESDRPEGVEAYAAPNLLADVGSILQALGLERVSIVGHDWGAFVAWAIAAFMPEAVESLVAISVGHPGAFASAGFEQWEKSWYMLWYLFPGVAEATFPRENWAVLRRFVGNEGDIDAYISDLSRPGALTASLNWYRANVSPEMIAAPDPPQVPPARCPTMGIWSTGDFALTERQMVESAKFVEGPFRYERIEGVSHWIPLAAPERLTSLLIDFLGSHGA